MRFPGQRHDAATGLYHNYFRDYDPTVGRYVQSDPIGLAGGISTYAYGNGAPLGFSDPLGLRGNPLGDMFGRMIARPIVQRMGGGLLARGASAAAKARAQARRAAALAQRMQGIWGRIARCGKRGADEVPQGCEGVANSRKPLFSSNELTGVERASDALIESVAKRGSITWATKGSDAERYLNYRNAEAAALGPEDIILRPNPSKPAVLEELLHGTQQRLGIVDRLGTSGMGSAETHVKDFMLRHQRMLGLSAEDARRLQILRDMGL